MEKYTHLSELGRLVAVVIVVSFVLVAATVGPSVLVGGATDRARAAQEMDSEQILATVEAQQAVTQGLIRDLLSHEQVQLDRSMRAVEHVAVSGDIAQSMAWFSFMIFCAAIIVASVAVIYAIRMIGGRRDHEQ